MRALFTLALAAPLLVACASTGPGPTYQAEFAKLDQDCRARGGILTPTGITRGQPQLDYACTISGPSGRLTPGNDGRDRSN